MKSKLSVLSVVTDVIINNAIIIIWILYMDKHVILILVSLFLFFYNLNEKYNSTYGTELDVI